MKKEQKKETIELYSQARGTNVNHQTMQTKEVPKPKTSIPKREERNLKKNCKKAT